MTRALRHEVDQMKAVGFINPQEAQDLRELVDAERSHHNEGAISRDAK